MWGSRSRGKHYLVRAIETLYHASSRYEIRRSLLRAGRCIMAFYEEMRAEVLRHGAINNPYLDRFTTGALTDEEVRTFAVEFYNFARFFPKILVAQLVNTEDEAVADELTQ